MSSALYTVAGGNPTRSADLNQLVGALTGTLDPGGIAFAGPTAAPGAPGITIDSGGVLTGDYQWCSWWITGVPNGSNSPAVNATTGAGTATSTQTCSSSQGVLTAPASPPSTAIGYGVGRTKAGGSTFYVVGSVYLQANGTWPAYTDDTPDSSLSTLAPTTNTTGTAPTLGAGATIASGQTLAMDGATLSGTPTIPNSGGFVTTGGAFLGAGAAGHGWYTVGESGYVSFVCEDSDGDQILVVGVSGGKSVATLNNTLDDGSGGTIWSGKMALTSAGYLCWDAAMSTLPTSIGMGLIDPSVLGWGDGLLLNGAPFGTTAAVYANVDTGSSTRGLSLGDQEGSVWWADADGNQQMGGQLRSTLATGTAPLAVASTTMVDYLNAEFWGGAANNVQASIGSAGSPSPTSTGVGTSITCSGSLVILIGQGAAGLEATDAGSLYIMQSTYGIPGSGDAPHSGDTAVAVASASSNMGTSSVSVPLTPIGWATGLTNGTTYYFYLAYTQTGATMTGSSILAIQH